MRRIYIFLAIVIITFTLVGNVYAAPQVILNGQALTFDAPPVTEQGRTLVPLRAIFEALGATVKWDAPTHTITATKDSTQIKLIVGGKAYKNGQATNIDVPAKIIGGRTMVPLRFVSESLGCQVRWDSATQTITISTGNGTEIIKVNFIDVGQADAIYIELPDNNDILIDGGNKADGSTVVNYLKNEGVDDIELLIATHPHEDHIGGLPGVLDAFKVEKIIDSGGTAVTKIYQEYTAKVKAEGAVLQQDNYQTFTFGNTALQILTGPETWEDVNDYFVVCRLSDGNVNFLFTGDAGGLSEAALKGSLDAEILKVGHHGSRTSTSSAFLSRVKPQVAVISVGTGNSYGHPTPETLQRLSSAGAKVYRTDLNGNIVVTTDGITYSVSVSRGGQADAATQIKPTLQPTPTQQPTEQAAKGKYVGSIKSNKYHYPDCRYAKEIKPENEIWFKTEEEALAAGYEPCGACKP